MNKNEFFNFQTSEAAPKKKKKKKKKVCMLDKIDETSWVEPSE